MAKNKSERDEQRQRTTTPDPPTRSRAKRAGESPWHPAARFLVSVLVILHLLAVFSAPWDLSTQAALPPGYMALDEQGREPSLPPPNSPVWQHPIVPRLLRESFRDYLNLLYLNHGYEFFAPDPNASYLIRYRVLDSGGTEIASGEFPDLDEQWPRLLYHRHMMLAAQTGDMGEASGRRYARHLLQRHGGAKCVLEWVVHKLLSPQEILDGTPLDANESYVVLARIEESADENRRGSGNESPVAIREAQQ